MHTLQATRDVRKVSLWLGHASLQSTEIYLRADPTEKLEALAAMAPPSLKPGRLPRSRRAAGYAEVRRPISRLCRVISAKNTAAGKPLPLRTAHNHAPCIIAVMKSSS